MIVSVKDKWVNNGVSGNIIADCLISHRKYAEFPLQ